ncbi:hypothetical protein R1sor_012036 [Riccia sorocarpa]|uniref:DUF4283 domain-containing protein n=1 Tax=Riccia sorocarpa TaxID=122646 RepID=A0ABD3I695_9MARC
MSENQASGILNLQGKRTNERRISLLQRSLDLGDLIKRPRGDRNMANTNRNQTPMVSAAYARDNRTVISHNNVRRGDLFGGHNSHHSDARGLIMHSNETYETSPASVRGNSPAPAPNLSATLNSGPRERLNSPWNMVVRSNLPGSSSSGPSSPKVGLGGGRRETRYNLPFPKAEVTRDHTKHRSTRQHKLWRRENSLEIKDHVEGNPEDEVVVEHIFTVEQQLQIHQQKRRLEDCAVIFCTVDISPSRDAFQRWLYQEVENRTAIQTQHVKVLAPRHYLVYMSSIEDRDLVLAGGPYYMRQRMIYCTPWEPGFDTTKVLAKKMACWVDLLNLDPMIESTGRDLLGSLGPVLQMAGVTDKEEGKFANIRGCVLLDMTKPLPTTLILNLNQVGSRHGQQPQKPQKPQPPAGTGNPSTSGNIYEVLNGEGEEAQNEEEPTRKDAETLAKDPVENSQTEREQVPSGQNTMQVEEEREEVQKDVAMNALDLNHSSAASIQASQGNGLEVNSKDKRKAKKKAAKEKKQLERIRERERNSRGEPSSVRQEAEEEEESSEDDEERPQKFWQETNWKKQKGNEETMDTNLGWETQRQQGGGGNPVPENAGNSQLEV